MRVDPVFWVKRDIGFGQEGGKSDLVEVGRFAKDAAGFFAPVIGEAGFLELLLDEGEGLEEKLALVGEGHGVLAGDAAGELIEEDFAEGDVDGCSGLEIADGVEDVGGDDVAVSDVAHLLVEMVMAERGVAGIDGVGAALAVGTEMLAAGDGDGGGGWVNRGAFGFDSGCWHGGSFENVQSKRIRCRSGNRAIRPGAFFVSIDSRRVSAGRIRKYGI